MEDMYSIAGWPFVVYIEYIRYEHSIYKCDVYIRCISNRPLPVLVLTSSMNGLMNQDIDPSTFNVEIVQGILNTFNQIQHLAGDGFSYQLTYQLVLTYWTNT